MTYKEFYFWLDGYLTNRLWTEIGQQDIETITEKMKGVVKEDEEVLKQFDRRRNDFHRTILPTIKIDPLGDVPKIICEDDKKNNTFF